MTSPEAEGVGLSVQAFSIAISDFLVFYQYQINELQTKYRLLRQDISMTNEEC